MYTSFKILCGRRNHFRTKSHHPVFFHIFQDDKEEVIRHMQNLVAARRVQHTNNPILAAAAAAHQQGHTAGGGGHSSPNSESSGYMSNVSPQQLRTGSTSPNSNCEDALDLSTDSRRHGSSSGASSRSSPVAYPNQQISSAHGGGVVVDHMANQPPNNRQIGGIVAGSVQSSQHHNLSITSSGSVSQRSTPSPIKEELPQQYNGYHNGLPPASGLLRPPPAGPPPGVVVPPPPGGGGGGPPAILPYNPACIQARRDSIDVEAIIHRNLTLQPPPEVMASVRIGAPPPNQVIHICYS